MIIIARKYKQVHRKELTFDLADWEKIECRAEACHTDTTKYLRKMILDRDPIFYDMKEIAPLINGMRIISRNINQIAMKANETNTIGFIINLFLSLLLYETILSFADQQHCADQRSRQKHQRNSKQDAAPLPESRINRR